MFARSIDDFSSGSRGKLFIDKTPHRSPNQISHFQETSSSDVTVSDYDGANYQPYLTSPFASASYNIDEHFRGAPSVIFEPLKHLDLGRTEPEGISDQTDHTNEENNHNVGDNILPSIEEKRTSIFRDVDLSNTL